MKKTEVSQFDVLYEDVFPELKAMLQKTYSVPQGAILRGRNVTIIISSKLLDYQPRYFDVTIKIIPKDRELTPVLEGIRFQLNHANQSMAMLPQTLDQWGQTTFHGLEAGEYQLVAPALASAGISGWLSEFLAPLAGARWATALMPDLEALASPAHASSAEERGTNTSTEVTDGPFTFTQWPKIDDGIPVEVSTDRKEWDLQFLPLKVWSEASVKGILMPLQWSEPHALCRADFFIETNERLALPETYEPISADTLAEADLSVLEMILTASILRSDQYTRRTWRKVANLQEMPESVKTMIIQALDQVE